MIRDCNELTTQCQSTHTSKHPASNPNKRNSTATDEYDFQMELDEQFGVNNPTPSLDDIDDDDLDDKQAKLQQLTANTIAYGQELGAEFANDPRREVKQALKDTFALIAYENAKESSLAPLLEIDGRVPVAEELNSAILGMSRLFSTYEVAMIADVTNSKPRKVKLSGYRATRPADRSPCWRTGRRGRGWRLCQRPERFLAVGCFEVTAESTRTRVREVQISTEMSTVSTPEVAVEREEATHGL
jgi:hypothetical protein